MKLTKKTLSNILFIGIIGLLLYTPTRVYFIRLISFSPAVVNQEKRVEITSYNFKLKGLNTSNVDFSTLENKVVFVNFWATWCPPCIAEFPSIQELYDAYKDKVVFLFITNEDWETVAKFYTEKGYNLPTYTLLNKVPEELQSSSIPATYILDNKGKIVVQKIGPADWNTTKVRDLLNDLIK